MRKRIRQILGDETGFSLVELLATIVIVTLASAMLAVGVPAAMQTYGKLVDSSNAQLLLTTTLTRVRGELAYATAVSVDESTDTITYTNGRTNRICTLKKADITTGKLVDGDGKAVVQPQKGAMDMFVTFGGVVKHDQIVEFSDVQVVVAGKYDGRPLAELGSYDIRIIKTED